MLTVFEKTLKTYTGKTLVRSHINDHDAQKIFRDLSTYSLTSTKASLDSSTILSYTTSARLGDGSWKNGTHAFILHWLDQVRKYKAPVPVADHFSEVPKKTMLQNAVHNIAELCAVKTTGGSTQNPVRGWPHLLAILQPSVVSCNRVWFTIWYEDLKRIAVVLTTPPSRSIILHNMSANDLISHIKYWRLVKQGIVNLTDTKPQDYDDNKKSFLAHLTQRKVLPPGDIQCVLSDTASCSSGNKTP